MDALVHQDATASHLHVSAPGDRVVVLLAAVPLELGVEEHEAAEATAVDGLAHQAGGIEEARLEDACKDSTLGLGRRYDAVTALRRRLQRLLHQEGLAVVDRGEAGLEMALRRGRDGDDVDLGVGHEGLQTRMALDAVPAGEGLPLLQMMVVACDQPRIIKRVGRIRMHVGDGACAHDADAEGPLHVLISLLKGLPRAAGEPFWLRDVKASTTMTTT